MEGPRYEYHDDSAYLRRLDREDVDTWYGTLCKAASPRGFSRQDHESGPSAGDVVVTKRTIHNNAARALGDLERGIVPSTAEFDALEVIIHERTHCMVRLDGRGVPLREDLRRYSHPDEPWPALTHAIGKDCRFGVNAFTGVLRLRPSARSLRNELLNAKIGARSAPWHDGLQWFAAHALDMPKPYAA